MMKKWCFLAALYFACSFSTVGYGAAIPGQAYWSFNDGTGGVDGLSPYSNPHTFSPAHEEDLPGVPEFRITGTNVLASSSQSAPQYITASGLDVGHGRSVQWESSPATPGPQVPSLGNSFTFAFNSTGYEDFHVKFDYRASTTLGSSFTFSDIQYSLDEGATYLTAVAAPVLTINQAWHLIDLDLSSLGAIENKSNVLLRFNLPDLTTASTSYRMSNVELTSTAIVPEPSALLTMTIGSCALTLFRRRRR